ncbi:MAG: hypothetical protein WCP18_03365 [bacterium]
MPFNLIKFFTPSYFFDMQPSIEPKTAYFLLGVFGIMAIAGIGIMIAKKVKKYEAHFAFLLQKYATCLLTMGLIGLIMVWLRFEQAFFLSSRFMLVIWLLAFAWWLAMIIKYQYKALPKIKEQIAKHQEFRKYLPKRK